MTKRKIAAVALALVLALPTSVALADEYDPGPPTNEMWQAAYEQAQVDYAFIQAEAAAQVNENYGWPNAEPYDPEPNYGSG